MGLQASGQTIRSRETLATDSLAHTRDVGTAAPHPHGQRNAQPAGLDRHAQPLRAEGTVGFRRYGLLLDPYQSELPVSGHRGNQLDGLYLQGQSDDRLRLPQQHGPRRTIHLFAHAAQAGQGLDQLRRRRFGRRTQRPRLLCPAAQLPDSGHLAAVHSPGPQQAFSPSTTKCRWPAAAAKPASPTTLP